MLIRELVMVLAYTEVTVTSEDIQTTYVCFSDTMSKNLITFLKKLIDLITFLFTINRTSDCITVQVRP